MWTRISAISSDFDRRMVPVADGSAPRDLRDLKGATAASKYTNYNRATLTRGNHDGSIEHRASALER